MIPERFRSRSPDNSPLRTQNREIIPDIVSGQLSLKNLDKTESLRIDNQSLDRRSTMVKVELERVIKELNQVKDTYDQMLQLNNTRKIQLQQLESSSNNGETAAEHQIRNMKQENEMIEKRIAEIKNDTIQITDKNSSQREGQFKDKQHTHNQQIKLSQITRQIDQTYVMNQDQVEQIKDKQLIIDEIESQLSQNAREISLIDDQVKILQQKRDFLLTQLEDKANQHDATMNLMGQEQQHLTIKSNSDENQVASKWIFSSLNLIMKAKQRAAFKEIFNYAQFDVKCKKKLKVFGTVTWRLGLNLKRKGLHQWYINSLKPKNVITENERVATHNFNNTQKSKIFYILLRNVKLNNEIEVNQNRSVFKLRHYFKNLDLSAKKICFGKWKSVYQNDVFKQSVLNKLIQKKQNTQLKNVINIWKSFSEDLLKQVRLTIINRQFTQLLFNQANFSSLQQMKLKQKSDNYFQKAHTMNKLQNMVNKKKFMLRMQLMTLIFREQNTLLIMKTCYDALKHNNEQQKCIVLKEALQQDVNCSIEQTHKDIIQEGEVQLEKYKRNTLNVVQTMLGKRLYSYFYKWKQFKQAQKAIFNEKFKENLLKLYTSKLRYYLSKWTSQKGKKQTHKTKQMVFEISSSCDQIVNETIEQKNEIQQQVEVASAHSRKQTGKLAKRITFRFYRDAWIRWQELMHNERTKESGAFDVIKKLRRKMMSDYFNHYKNQVQDINRLEIMTKRADNLHDLFNKRLVINIYHSWLAYNHQHNKAKNILKILYQRLIINKMKRGLYTWRQSCEHLSHDFVKEVQNDLTDNIETKNQVLGAFQNITDRQDIQMKEIHEDARKIARKQLITYFTRFYVDGTKRCFRIWKLTFNKRKQKESIVKKCLYNQKKQAFDLFKSTLASHNSRNVKKEKNKMIQQTIFSQEAEISQIEFQQETAEDHRKRSQATMASHQPVIDRTQKRRDMAIESMSRRNIDLWMSSKKRRVFLGWQQIAKRQKSFYRNLSKVCAKSFYAEAFQLIKEQYQENRIEYNKNNILQKVYLRYGQTLYKQAINLWKLHAFKIVFEGEKEANEEYLFTVQKQNEKQAAIMDHCSNNVETFFKKKLKQKILSKWISMRELDKVRDIKTKQSSSKFADIKKKRVLQKWIQRQQLTQKLRFRWKAFHENYKIRIKFKIFEALRWKKQVNNHMAKSLEHFEKFMRTKLYQDSFKDIYSFYLSKKVSNQKLKLRSVRDSLSFLVLRHEKILRMYFNRFRVKVTDEDQRKRRLRAIFKNLQVSHRHTGFRRWKAFAESENLSQELNDTGPVTEEVFEGRRACKNLLEFMRFEGYDEEEIKQTYEGVDTLLKQRMNYAIMRYKQGQTEEGRLKIKIFDHFRMLVAFIKLMKYQLANCGNRVQFMKCDMQTAFNKWRVADSKRAGALRRLKRSELKAMNLKQTSDMLRQANTEAESDLALKHLSMVRDELMEHYIRGQKFSLAACRGKHLQGMGIAISRWKKVVRFEKRNEKQTKIINYVERLAALKDRIREKQRENDLLSDENEELRRYSMNGFKIAQNVNKLSAEREKLTVDLADYNKQISELINKNQKLKKALAEIQGVNPQKENKNFNMTFNQQKQQQTEKPHFALRQKRDDSKNNRGVN